MPDALSQLSQLPPELRATVESELRARLARVDAELERARFRAAFTAPDAPRPFGGGRAADWLPMTEDELHA